MKYFFSPFFRKIFLVSLGFFGLVLFPLLTLGASDLDTVIDDISEKTALPKGSVLELIIVSIRVILGLFSVLLTGVVLWAGSLLLIHNGEEEKVEIAKKLLISSILGVTISATSYAIVSGVLGLDFS